MGEDDLIGKGSTTLDYLRVRHEWLGELINSAEAEVKRLRGVNADLLAACERIIAAYQNHGGGVTLAAVMRGVLADVRAAVAKAKGETK